MGIFHAKATSLDEVIQAAITTETFLKTEPERNGWKVKPTYNRGIGSEVDLEKMIKDEVNKVLCQAMESQPNKGKIPWASNIVLVKKKDGTQRFCVDYRQLNAATIKDAYPLPRIDETLDALSGAQWFSTLDLASGYWQVGLSKDAKEKSAFVADGGLYSWNVMPFGLCNAPATFERLMDKLARWLEVIAAYDIEIIHRAGRSHGNADALSRRPCGQCGRGMECEFKVKGEETVKARVIMMTIEKRLSEMRKDQLDNPNIKPVLEAMERKTRPPKEEVSAMSKKVKVLLEHWEQLEIRDGILCRRWESIDGKEVKWRLVLPGRKMNEVLKELHGSALAGHLGATKTLKSGQMRYNWVGMKADVRSFFRKCESCARRKSAGKKRRAPLQQRKSGSPMEQIALDILGPLPETNDGNKYIMEVADYYTKFVEAYPIPNEKASTVAPKLVKEFMCRYGVPTEIHTDQGRNFESQLFKEVCQILGIKKTRTTAYNPKSDGMIERFNRTLLDMLVTLIEPGKNQRDWDKYVHIHVATTAYRSSVHETIGEMPNMMMFKRELKMLSDQYVIQPNMEVGTHYVEELRDRMDKVYTRITEHSQKNLRRQKRNYDKKIAGSIYEEGNFVWLRNNQRHKGISPKLSYRWNGPFKIKTKLSDVIYRIKKSPGTKVKVVHFDRLKPCEGDEPKEWKTAHTRRKDDVNDAREMESNSEEVDHDSTQDVTVNRRQEDTRRYPLRNRRPAHFFY
eukprot:XP_011675925.1 PREDICTED: uncharacterized protein K02A2.6-like [Strongylocentrotus purpuratus]